MTSLKRIKVLLSSSVLRMLIALTILIAIINGVSAETKMVEVPSWVTKNGAENPLNVDNLTLAQSSVGAPRIGILVPSTVIVKGRLSSMIGEQDHLWIAVKPSGSVENWWPQTGGPLPVINNEFEGNAFLGGNNGDMFEIGILIVGDEINNRFSDWLKHSRSTNNWPPITEGSPGRNNKVSKQEIEANEYASISVILLDN